MGKWLVAYVVAAVCLFAVDMVWLGVIAKDLYRSALGDLLRDPPLWSAAIAFYALYLVGLVVFAIAPALDAGHWTRALVLGGLYGFFAYMTYDLTNLATLKNWPVSIVLIDIVWGTCLSGVSATAGWLAATAWSRAA